MTRSTKGQKGSSHVRRKALRLEKGPQKRAGLAAEEMEARIAHRAYEIFVEEGSQPGRELDHWLRAEKEIAELEDRGPHE